MKYTGQFSTIENHTYYINITTNGDSSNNQDIKLGARPLITTYEGSDENIYKPVKYSSSTIKILTDDYLFDLYSSQAQQNKVEVKDENNNIIWIGYVTPNLYNQGFSNPIEELEVECVDALSTLQNYKYTPISGTKEIVSFINIINHILSKCNAYTTFYISNNIQPKLTDGREASLVENIVISEQNFFDEDDEPMTFQEVLEEICQYLNLTCISDGDKVFFLDYTAIKNDIDTYYQYSIGNTTGTLVTLSHTKEINSSDYAQNGATISLGNTYNQVSVKASLYSFEPVIPEIFSDELIQYLKLDLTGNWKYYDEFTLYSSQTKKNYKCFFRFYKHPFYKTYYYDKETMDKVTPATVTYQTLQDTVGATIIKHYNKEIKEDENDEDIINSIEWKDYICFHCHNKADSYLRPMVELDINDTPPSIISTQSYFVIKGKYSVYDLQNEVVPLEGYSREDDDFNPDYLHLKCSLEVNGKFWNGQFWQDEFTAFNLPFSSGGQTDHFIGKEFSVKNNIDYTMCINDSGYAIRVPSLWTELATTNTRPSFVIYQPHNIDGTGHPTYSAYLSDLSISVVVPTEGDNTADINLENNDTDTLYTNIIDENFVNEMNDVTFKICTWDDKVNNYSCVMLIDNQFQLSEFLDLTHNKATNQDLRQEEHYIYNMVTQYKDPAIMLEANLKLSSGIKPYTLLTDKYLVDRKFIVDSYSVDWEYEKNTIKIIEKK